jgi:hypothetical protein
MANRVTGSEVKEIINTSLTAEQVEPFITTANMIITGKCASTYSSDELVELEKWLAAHFVSIRVPSRSAVTKQKAGPAEQEYSVVSKNAKGLQITPYGQQVMIMDYNNTLASLGTRSNTVFRVFGASNEDFSSDEVTY